MDKKKIGIIGCGAIGSVLAEYAGKHLSSYIAKIVLFDTDVNKTKMLAGKLTNAAVARSIEDLIGKVDLVIESASSQIVPDVFETVLKKKKDLMIMSIGGLLDKESLLDRAEQKGVHIILPSGAIAGIDGLKSYKAGGIEKVTLTTRKPPKSIKGAPYLLEKNIDVEAIKDETVVFEGNAREAINGFPRNINVAALLSIAGIGAEKTKVKIVVSPKYSKNIHEIEIQGNAGRISICTENVPSPDNPKTSHLAVLAAIASLKEYFNTIQIGT